MIVIKSKVKEVERQGSDIPYGAFRGRVGHEQVDSLYLRHYSGITQLDSKLETDWTFGGDRGSGPTVKDYRPVNIEIREL